jgi:hypothetical protein
MRPNPSKAWSRGQCGSIAINYGKFVTEDELRNFDVGSYYCLLKNTHISDDSDIIDWIPDPGSQVRTKGEDAFSLYLDTSIDSSEHFDGEPRQFE